MLWIRQFWFDFHIKNSIFCAFVWWLQFYMVILCTFEQIIILCSISRFNSVIEFNNSCNILWSFKIFNLLQNFIIHLLEFNLIVWWLTKLKFGHLIESIFQHQATKLSLKFNQKSWMFGAQSKKWNENFSLRLSSLLSRHSLFLQ